MKTPVTPAKISCPSSSGIFPRERLFQLFDHSDQAIFWITGPPGSGKTALVASWLETRKIRSLCYQMDEGDADPASFFHYLSLAVKKANPRMRKPLPPLTSEYQFGISTFSRRFFENVYSRLVPIAQNSRLPFAIVFDNYHEVAPGALFHEILNAGIEHVPSGILIICISREDPPKTFARLKANSLMKTIGWDELKFTLEESNAMVRLRGHGAVSPQVLGDLHKKTDGWAAGIVLSLERARNGGIESALLKVRASKDIFQYLTREIFERAEPATQEFLLKTSLFPLMSSKMAEALTGNHQAKRILSDLNERNYFTQKLESETPHYQYHPLFREFLLHLAREAFNATELMKLDTRAAAILEEDGRPEDAIALLQQAKAWPEQVQLILRHGPNLAAQGRNRTLAAWIKDLPDELVRAEPWLLYWKGVCRLPFSPPESRALFEAAFNLFRTGRDAHGVYLSLSGVFDSIAWTFGEYGPFDAALDLLEEVTIEFPNLPSIEIEARLLANKLFAIVFRQPWHEDLNETADRAFAIFPDTSNIDIKTLLLRCLFLHSIYFGKPQTAETLFQLCRGLLKTPDLSHLIKIGLKNDEANYYRSIAEFQKGREAVKEALDLASATGVFVMEPFLLGQGAVAALELGYIEEAESFLEKMAASVDQIPLWARNFYHHLSGWKSLVQGDLWDALAHTETALRLIVQAGIPHSIAHSRLIHALALHSVNRNHEARDYLLESLAFARKSGSFIIEFACLLAEAKFAFDEGDDACGLSSVANALSLGRTNGYLNVPYCWLPSMMTDLCQRALEAGIEVDYVRHLIRKRNLMPDPPPIDCEQWPWALKVYTLGRFKIVRGDEVMQFSGKVQKRPLELLKFLIAGGGSATHEQIADSLWPDANGDTSYSTFKMTLSRLRRLLDVEDGIRFQEGRVSLDPRACYVDVQAFENITGQFEKGIKEGTASHGDEHSNILKLADKAVAIYEGHFLPDEEEKLWTAPCRERLRRRFSMLITRTGDLLGKAEQWEKALDYYRKGIGIDDLNEAFYQGLMICHRELGHRAQAKEAYHHCKKLLAAKLGIEPSDKTSSIYHSL